MTIVQDDTSWQNAPLGPLQEGLSEAQKCRRRFPWGPHTEHEVLLGLLGAAEEHGPTESTAYARGYLALPLPDGHLHLEEDWLRGCRSRTDFKSKLAMAEYHREKDECEKT